MMVPCDQITNPKFNKGGSLQNYHASGELCPIDGNIDYNGVVGTNLFVQPAPYYWD